MLIPNKFSGYSRDGIRLYPMDGGGGGGSSTGTQTQISELPEWAKPYAKSTLEKGAALSETPYQTYNQPRIAGFSPMQQQSQQAAANMQTNQLTGLGGGIAAGAGMGGLGYAMQQNPQNFQQNVGGYMNPYLQMALAPQLAEANRNYDIGATKQQSAATQAGAFGGSREAIMAAENERNRNMGLQNIIGQGYNTAFNQAQNQYNQSQQAQLQGLNTALQGAGQLGALGGQQFQQGMDINKLQNAYGGQQQALRQQGLDQAYQDFLNQQNQPYKQVGFMSDLIRGLPLGQVTSKSIYEPDPGMAQQIGSLGMGAYGLSKFMADGGMAYADGGEVEGYKYGGGVDSRENVEDIVRSMRGDTNALQRSYQAAKLRGDRDQMEAIESEMAIAASLRKGIAGGVTNDMADRMAGGGVVAFAKGGLQDYMKTLSDLGNEDISATPEERLQGVKGALPGVKEMYGPSATAPYMEEVKKERAGLSKMKDQGEGLAFLAASQALLRPGSKSRAISGAMGAFGTEIMKMEKEKREADRALRQSEITLATAEQARADGQIGKAQELYQQGQNDKKDALNRKIGVAEKQATIAGGLEQANIQAAATLGKKTDLERLTATEYAALLESGSPDNAATRAQAGRNAANLYGKMAGTVRADMAAGKDRIKVAEAVDMMLMKPGVEKQRYRELQAADKAGGTNKAAEYRRSLIDAEMGSSGGGQAAPTQQSTTKGPDLNTFMVEARKVNPGVSDADLRAYYDSKYK